MSAHASTDEAVGSQALTCQAAANLLHARERVGVTGSCVEADVERLLRAVSRQLITDSHSLPITVRAAATQLAEHVANHFSIPVSRRCESPAAPVGALCAAAGRADLRPATRFDGSVAPGRMG
jgi:hypothetical protein